MPKPPKYDAVYAEGPDALGPPFAEIINYFKGLKPPMDVLDLGAGQGRDAVVIAQMGFRAHAVDISKVGLRDLDEKAKALSLNIETQWADLEEFTPKQGYDVLLADRTFHMLKPEQRHACLERCLAFANPMAHVLIVDERSNLPGLKTVFERDGASWQVTFENKGYLFLRKGN